MIVDGRRRICSRAQVSICHWIDETNVDSEIQAKSAEDWVNVDGVRYFCSSDVEVHLRRNRHQFRWIPLAGAYDRGAAFFTVSESPFRSSSIQGRSYLRFLCCLMWTRLRCTKTS